MIKEQEYVFTEDMAEISGFGGGYEDTCRQMVVLGLNWLKEHPTAEPQFSGYKGIYGIIHDDNQDAKDLLKAMTDGVDCTGAMVQATVGHVMAIHSRSSWDWYVEDSKRRGLPKTLEEAAAKGHEKVAV